VIEDTRTHLGPARRREPAAARGFTLVELLIVTLIFGVIVGVITTCLLGGIRTWDYARKFGVTEPDALLKMEIVHRDVASAFYFHDISFAGDSTYVSFPGLVDRIVDGKTEARIGTVKYWYDADKKMFMRKAWLYPSPEPDDRDAEKMLAGVNAVEIRYHALPIGKGGAVTVCDGWNSKTNLPAALSVDMFFGAGSRPVTVSRTIMLPIAGTQAVNQVQQQVAGRK
jgi:prepilin-type N-terminal cleavage/methylation domain-containing protein